ncbi:MAG: tetratricopeptide repeat protein [Acidobacteriia bacterium]|nr:tetratricopeptide repeat protein [Terriglobia bacterium]
MFSIRRIFVVILLVLLPGVAGAAQTAQDLLAEGRVDDAITSLQSRISTTPKDAESYNLLCRAYFALQSWDRGIAACQKAVSLEPDNGWYHLWLGRIYGEKADRVNFFSAASLAGKVRNEFETAVRLSPQSAVARTDLAEFYLEAPGIVGGGRDKAAEQAEVLAKLDPAKARWVKGRIAEKKKDTATAEREYRAAIEASHGSANSWLNLALFYRHVGRLDDMEDALSHASSAEMNQPEVLVDAAETLIRAGRNFPGAIELLRRYLSSSSTVEEAPAFRAHYLLGTLLEKQGNAQAAAQEYRAALSMAKSFSQAQDALNRLNR